MTQPCSKKPNPKSVLASDSSENKDQGCSVAATTDEAKKIAEAKTATEEKHAVADLVVPGIVPQNWETGYVLHDYDAVLQESGMLIAEAYFDQGESDADDEDDDDAFDGTGFELDLELELGRKGVEADDRKSIDADEAFFDALLSDDGESFDDDAADLSFDDLDDDSAGDDSLDADAIVSSIISARFEGDWQDRPDYNLPYRELDQLAYIKPVKSESGELFFTLYAADGTPLLTDKTVAAMSIKARAFDLKPLRLH